MLVLQEHNHSADPQTAEALRLKSVLYGDVKAPIGKIHLQKRLLNVKDEMNEEEEENKENVESEFLVRT